LKEWFRTKGETKESEKVRGGGKGKLHSFGGCWEKEKKWNGQGA